LITNIIKTKIENQPTNNNKKKLKSDYFLPFVSFEKIRKSWTSKMKEAVPEYPAVPSFNKWD